MGHADRAERNPRSGILLGLALTLVAFAYAPALGGGFVWDDRVLIERSPLVTELRPLAEYFRQSFWSAAPQAHSSAYYRPLALLSYALDFRIWRGNPFGFHLTNLSLHLACVALLFGLCRRAGAAPAISACAAALFGLFPRLSESVAWISGRTDLLAAVGALGALALHGSEPAAWRRRLGSAGLLLLGLLGKEVALAGGAALLALELERVRAGSSKARALRNLAPAVSACLLWLALRIAAGAAAFAPPRFSIAERLLFALEALGAYAAALLDPLRPDLQIGLIGSVDGWRVLLGAAALLLFTAGTLRLARAGRPPLETAGVALAVAALLPVLHLLPLDAKVLAADRFLYVPAAGLALALASAAARSPALRLRPAFAVCVALGLAFGVATARRSTEWTDELTLWQRAAERAHPLNSRPALMLGESLLRAGEPERALTWLHRAERVEADYARLQPWADSSAQIKGNVAGALAALGRYPEAIHVLRELIERDPEHPQHRLNLAVVYARELELEAALRELERARELLPGYPAARALYPRLLEARERLERLGPEPAREPPVTRAERARVMASVGRRADASRLWSLVVLDPASPDALRREGVEHLELHAEPGRAERSPGATRERAAVENSAL
jgi:tetratricopeptide (TPR) repeat protein